MLQSIRVFFADLRKMPALVESSVQELRRVSSLTGAAMLSALNVILNQFTVVLSLTQKLGFSFLTVGVSGMLYGPVLTGLIGAGTDILKFFVGPPNGPFFPGFTLSEFLQGFLYGLFLYQKPVTLKRTFAAKLTTTLVINMTLTPLWLSMMYGDAFYVLVGARLLKNVLMLPIETALLYFLLKKVREFRPVRNENNHI